ncbi:MAG: hypothetical protein LBS84_12995 [Clostridiales bacterium]|jgi:hypothetical protein|nr:hypothetical protein [Clostridiales bacterium]
MVNDFEIQLDKIRVDLYEETKNMTNAEAAHEINESTHKLAERYGFKIIKSTPFSMRRDSEAI